MTHIGVASTRGGEVRSLLELWGYSVERDANPLGLIERCEVLVIDVDGFDLSGGLVHDCDVRGVRVIALAESPESRLRAVGLGVTVIDSYSLSTALAEALTGAVAREKEPRPEARGRIVLVWGAPGSPGATTLAVNLCAEWESSGFRCADGNAPARVCLVDLDQWAPSLAAALGRNPEVPGAVAAARLAEVGELSDSELARLAVAGPGASVLLSGLVALDRWPEATAARISALLDVLVERFDLVVIDAGSHSSADERRDESHAGPRRTDAVDVALQRADVTIGVGAADPIGLARIIRAWPNWRGPQTAKRVLVVNRVRSRVLGVQPAVQANRMCRQFLNVTPFATLPDDPKAADLALARATPLCSAAPRSALRSAIAACASQLVPKLTDDASVS